MIKLKSQQAITFDRIWNFPFCCNSYYKNVAVIKILVAIKHSYKLKFFCFYICIHLL